MVGNKLRLFFPFLKGFPFPLVTLADEEEILVRFAGRGFPDSSSEK